MAKGLPKLNLHIEAASSALTVLRSLLAEQLHEDDRKKLDGLIDRAAEALDNASALAANLRSRIEDVADQL